MQIQNKCRFNWIIIIDTLNYTRSLISNESVFRLDISTLKFRAKGVETIRKCRTALPLLFPDLLLEERMRRRGVKSSIVCFFVAVANDREIGVSVAKARKKELYWAYTSLRLPEPIKLWIKEASRNGLHDYHPVSVSFFLCVPSRQRDSSALAPQLMRKVMRSRSAKSLFRSLISRGRSSAFPLIIWYAREKSWEILANPRDNF